MKYQTLTALILGYLLLSVTVASATEIQKVNLNEAELEELSTLQGVGSVIAQRILAFRQNNGPFLKIEDLMNVRGIGETKFLQLREQVTIGSSAGEDEEKPPTQSPDSP